MRIRTIIASAACALACGIACAATPHAESEPLKAAWVYSGSRNDEGWSQQHDVARQAVARRFGSRILTHSVDNVNTAPDAERVIRDLVAQGNRLIFGTSVSFMTPMLKVAKEFPDVRFEHAAGFRTAPNLSTYNARFYQARYLAGRLAGSMTRSNRLGYVAALPIPEVLQGINAYVLGAQSVNPSIEVRVVWTNAWYDLGKETDATKTLIGQGCDVMTHHTDSQAVASTCESAGVKVISYHAVQKKAAPTQLIAAVTHHWEEFYTERVSDVINDTWKVKPLWGGAELAMVRLSEITPKADPEVVSAIEDIYEKMQRGQFKVFVGPVVDSTGRTVIEAGKVPDDEALSRMNYFVKGVSGKVPKI